MAAVFGLLVGVLSLPVFAQTITGLVSGTVVDGTGSGHPRRIGDAGKLRHGAPAICYHRFERRISGTYAVQANPPIQYNPVQYYGSLSTFLNNQGVISPTSVCGNIPTNINQTTYNFSFGVQRDMGFRTVLDVAYVGALGRHLLQSVNLNTIPYGAHFTNIDPTTKTALADNFDRPYLGYATINEYEAIGNSSYHSLQVQGNRRFAHGLQFGAVWTWSKFMDYMDNDQQSISLYVNPKVWNYGKSTGYP